MRLALCFLLLAGPLQAWAQPVGPSLSESSAGLFVGVNEFSVPGTQGLRYAVNDAVALAHAFVEAGLIEPRNVQLALGGHPTGTAALQYDELAAAGAQRRGATLTDVLLALNSAAGLAEEGGTLVVSLSTHGFERGGRGYVLVKDSDADDTATTLALRQVSDRIGRSRAERRLLLVDACRNGSDLPPPTYGGAKLTTTAVSPQFAELVRSMEGTAVMLAANSGQYSWESPDLQQGVFTHFFVQGMLQEAPSADSYLRLRDVLAYASREVNRYTLRKYQKEQHVTYGGPELLRDLPLRAADNVSPRYDAETYRNLGLSLLRNGQGTEAVTVLEEGTQRYPDDEALRAELLNAYAATYQFERAVRGYERMIANDPENPLLLYNYGSTLLQLDRYEEAIVQLTKATRLNPSDANAHYNLGAAYLNKGFVLTQRLAEEELSDAEVEQIRDDRNVLFRKALIPFIGARELTEAAGENVTDICNALFQVYTPLGMTEEAEEVGRCAGID